VGYGGFAIESVAARAGVSKATVYRHWPNKIALIADAFRALQDDTDPELDTGSIPEKLERILRHVAEIVADSPFSACLPALIDGAERDAELRQFHHRFQRQARAPLIALIDEGVRSGVLPARVDPEQAAFALLGAIFFRRLMTDAPFAPDEAPVLLRTVLGLGADDR